MKEDQRLVTIACFENGFEAQQAKIFLEEAGIHAVIFGETLGSAFPYSSKQDYVELQVFEEDRSRAEQVLEELLDSDMEENEVEDNEEQGDML